jgi:tetratricopeptide (TPR) repeat protein
MASAVLTPAEEARVESLLAKGQQAMNDYRLVTPEEDNARAYFEAVLDIDPVNARAQAGLDRIVAIYVTLAGREVSNGELDRAQRYLDRAFGIQPDNANLLALQATVDSRLNAPQLAASVPSSAGNPETAEIPVSTKAARPVATTPAVTPATGTLLRKRRVAERRYDVGTGQP